MKKLLFLFLVFILVLFTGCATLPHGRYEAELNIHDIFFAEYEPQGYDDCVKLDTASFRYLETPCLVIRFGGLEPDDNNIVYWAVAIRIYYNDTPMGNLGPASFQGDLDDEGAERDKYLVRVPLFMSPKLQPGLYRFEIMIMDISTQQTVETSIEFSLLPRTVSTDCMQLWDELMGKDPTTTPI